MRIFITGINGFIGIHLAEAILDRTDWIVSGFDLASDNISSSMLRNDRFEAFHQGDIFEEGEWLEHQVGLCDVVLPLAGIAKPAYYLKKPIWTFELDFEQNLKIVRMCSSLGKRLIFPSTSEVYGLCGDEELDEDCSPLITGPISKTRWIYSCSKQMMDRMIFAYGHEKGLRFSIFRPFNWVGPRLDTFDDAKIHAARVVTQMIHDLLRGGEIVLVDGGHQRRSFTWIGDAIDGLLSIIENKGGSADGEIFNIGNPANNHSMRELAEMLIDEMQKIPAFSERAKLVRIVEKTAEKYYGEDYDDTKNRVPSVEKMRRLLGWTPSTSMRDLLRMTAEWYAEAGSVALIN
jgi:nucleoside-diphosphate-sugar epimerase